MEYYSRSRVKRLLQCDEFMKRSLTFLVIATCTTVGCGTPGQTGAGAVQAAGRPLVSVTLVESAPVETTLDHPDVPNASEIWPAMIAGARRTIDFAEFYASEADTEALLAQSRLAPVVTAIEAALARGVKVRFLADAKFAKTYPATLERLGADGATVRLLDEARFAGGVLHAKYFVVDGEDAFVGSQNFDWRSLAHIFEMGVRVRSAAFAGALLDVFDTDWELAGGAVATTRVHAHAVVGDLATATGEHLEFAASPRAWLPDEAEWELPKMVAAIDAARRSVDVETLTYKTHSRDGSAFPDLDDALRRAAARGVRVRLLVADWSTKPGSEGRKALEALAAVAHVEVRVLKIPPWSGGDIPFARVAHAKYMVVDGARAWVGTSNWEGDYFTASRNVAVLVTGGGLPPRLDSIFDSNYQSPYATPLIP